MMISKIFAEHYAECSEMVVFINCGPIAHMAWRLFKPLLARRTVERVEILGTDWMDIVTEKWVRTDRLPVFWGGSNQPSEFKSKLG